jgi:hypothetical protein
MTGRVIAGVELVSGAYIVAAALLLMGRAVHAFTWPATTLAACGLTSALAGYWLWRGEQRGMVLSTAIQAAQLVHIVVPALAFVLVLGPSVTLGLPSGAPFAFRAALDPEVLLALGHHEVPLRFELNIVALVFFLALIRKATQARTPMPAISLPPAV